MKNLIKIISILSVLAFYGVDAQQVVKRYFIRNRAYHDDGF
jgi:hypothetical protein